MKHISQEEKKILERKQLILGAAFVRDGSATVPVCGLMPFPGPDKALQHWAGSELAAVL